MSRILPKLRLFAIAVTTPLVLNMNQSKNRRGWSKTQCEGESKSSNGKSQADHAPADIFSCAVPACADKADLFKRAMQADGSAMERKSNAKNKKASLGNDGRHGESKSKTVGDDNRTESGASSTNKDVVSGLAAAPLEYQGGCPVDRNELGRSTWDLIHTVAATYSESPTEQDQMQALHFIESLAWLYPCSYCAKDFQLFIRRYPPT